MLQGLIKYGAVLVCAVFTGCGKTEAPVTIELEGSPETTAAIQEWLAEHPDQVKAYVDKPYIVKIQRPEAETDYKIQIVRPDPDIDFKIRIYGSPQNMPEDRVRKLQELLRQRLQEKLSEEPQG